MPFPGLYVAVFVAFAQFARKRVGVCDVVEDAVEHDVKATRVGDLDEMIEVLVGFLAWDRLNNDRECRSHVTRE